jgi:lysozyme family protein
MNVLRFNACLAVILQEEGGYSKRAADRGGATDHGITHAVYSVWREEHGFIDQDIRQISSNEVAALYQEKYWIPSGAGNCPLPVDLLVFDCAVNSGPGCAVRTLQKAIGIDDDGVFGPGTRAILATLDPRTVASKFLAIRRAFYLNFAAHHPDQQEFLDGWLNRVANLEKICQNLSPTQPQPGEQP